MANKDVIFSILYFLYKEIKAYCFSFMCFCVCPDLKTSESVKRFFMKIGISVMSLEANPPFYLTISSHQ